VEKLRHGREMTGKIPFGAFWDTFTAPGNECVFGQARIRVFDLDICKLYPSVGKLVNQVDKLAL
jgi:hypothetical protein